MRWKISRLDLLGSRRHPSHWLSSKGPNYQSRVLLIAWYNWRTFWRKNNAVNSTRGSCFSTKMPRLNGHLQLRRNWPTWASNVLITHPFSGSGHVALPPVPWTETKLKVRHFSSDAELILAAETWLDVQISDFFLSSLQKLEQRDKKYI